MLMKLFSKLLEPFLDNSITLGIPVNLHESPVPVDTVVVSDVSHSMGTDDSKPNRLEASKQAVIGYSERMFELSPDNRLALIRFNNSAGVVFGFTPVSSQEYIAEGVNSLEYDGGTNIAAGLNCAGKLIERDINSTGCYGRFKRVLLLTDGHSSNPLKAAKRLKALGVMLEVIGVGGDKSAVNEKLLKQAATTDAQGYVHYRFISDTQTLIEHYKNIASGIAYKG